MELKICMLGVWILVDVVNALGVEQRRTALDAVNDVALLKQELSEVRTVLARDAGDEGYFGLVLFCHSLLTKS